jgi:ribulose-bisphosphate carboxylase large chain
VAEGAQEQTFRPCQTAAQKNKSTSQRRLETVLKDARIFATYELDTAMEPEKAAAIIAGEQSSGTFVPIPGETEELKARAAARYEIEPAAGLGQGGDGPQTFRGKPTKRYHLKLSWPLSNIGPSLPHLVATIAGNLYELQHVAALRLLDIDLPEAFSYAYPGPAYGVGGTRFLTQVYDRPLIGTIIKPSIGLSPEGIAEMVDKLCAGGIDFIKDDELQSSGSICPFDERVRAVMPVIHRHAERTGRKVMYAFNLTGELDEMRHRHDLVHDLGGSCVMLSLNSVGLTGFSAFRKHARLPIHAHRNGWGYLCRNWSYVAWQRLWRLAGADHMHVNGLDNKFQEANESVMASARECLTPMYPHKPCTVMPTFSSGQSAKQAPRTFEQLGSTDLIYLAGGGLFAHPGGIAAGIAALRQAWDATVAGVPLPVAAAAHRELREALETFGS